MGAQNWVQKLGQDFRHFLKVSSLVFPDIAQDCSLGQCLTASRAETSKKKLGGKIGGEMIFFSILMLPNIRSNLLVIFALILCGALKRFLEDTTEKCENKNLSCNFYFRLGFRFLNISLDVASLR